MIGSTNIRDKGYRGWPSRANDLLAPPATGALVGGMTSDRPACHSSGAFVAWAMERPETAHDELVAGEIVAMAPERAA